MKNRLFKPTKQRQALSSWLAFATADSILVTDDYKPRNLTPKQFDELLSEYRKHSDEIKRHRDGQDGSDRPEAGR